MAIAIAAILAGCAHHSPNMADQPTPSTNLRDPGYATPRALVEYLNALAGSNETIKQKLLDVHAVSRAVSDDARQGLELQIDFLDAFEGLLEAVKAKFGNESSAMLGMLEIQINNSISKMHIDSLKLTSDTTAEIQVDQPMGPPITQYLVKTDHGWMIDEDENYARTPQLAEGMKQLPKMIAAFQSVTKQVQDGTISNSMGIDMAIGQALGGGGASGGP